MIDCLVFVWIEKEHLSDVIKYYDSLGLKYVESISWAILDKSKTVNMKEFNPQSLLIKDSYQYFCKSKKSILIFRYVS